MDTGTRIALCVTSALSDIQILVLKKHSTPILKLFKPEYYK